VPRVHGLEHVERFAAADLFPVLWQRDHRTAWIDLLPDIG
jgi:hypothetical protein